MKVKYDNEAYEKAKKHFLDTGECDHDEKLAVETNNFNLYHKVCGVCGKTIEKVRM